MGEEGGNWPNDRLETTYQEARSVIEAQNATMADIDSKAMQTVRFNTILIGLLLAAANVTTPSLFEPISFGLSIAALVMSVLLGMITYNESDLFVGPSGKYIEELTHGGTTDPWYEDLLETFAGMISKNASDIVWNSWLLTGTQATLIIGIMLGILSVVI